ncbi:MAG: arginase family protein [Nanoarchaeota archaeon]|nr:arginase family protein [Nanoarchaeota archaeon]MBU1849903.1 arginase family protein [Nanoarchaeota archaeon]
MKLYKISFNAGALKKKEGQELAPEKITSFLKDFYLTENGVLPVINQETIIIDNNDVEESFKKIEQQLDFSNSFTMIVGGDHSITYPSFKTFSKNYENPGMVIFDAHPDVQDDFKISHEDYLRNLINDNIIKKENIIIIGIRNWSKEEVQYLKNNKIKFYTMRELSFEEEREICDAVMSVARSWDGFYLSIDIDVLDPAFAPGTGYAEPGGMTTRQLIYFLQRLKLLKNLKATDIVEVNPKIDLNDMTSKAAAKIIIELS